MNITIDRCKMINKDNLIAYVDVCIDDCVIIKGCRVLNGSKGKFVSVPSKKNEKDGKYYSHVWFKSKDQAADFNQQVLSLVGDSGESSAPTSPDQINWEE